MELRKIVLRRWLVHRESQEVEFMVYSGNRAKAQVHSVIMKPLSCIEMIDLSPSDDGFYCSLSSFTLNGDD
jgi:hypothetical protein